MGYISFSQKGISAVHQDDETPEMLHEVQCCCRHLLPLCTEEAAVAAVFDKVRLA